MLIAFNKPYGIISQFTRDGSTNGTLADFDFPKDVYPIGRLDADSEGLLLLSDETRLNAQLLLPEHAHKRIYHVQVEGIPDEQDMNLLQGGTLVIQGHTILPCSAALIHPIYQARIPPIRVRKTIPDSWIELKMQEGKNRQVRKMTAAIGHPTLRLIRVGIGEFLLKDIDPGTWRQITTEERILIFSKR
ncbi:MAG: pseudouridine synthase [Candidatus Kapaibacteriota bacterium]|jgi:23S rRNA pseudouridine2457 synthase